MDFDLKVGDSEYRAGGGAAHGEDAALESMEIRKSQENYVGETILDSPPPPLLTDSNVSNNTQQLQMLDSTSITMVTKDANQVKSRKGSHGGSQFNDFESNIPIEILKIREVKWVDMLDDWDRWMAKKFTKVKERCRKGIPSSMRSQAWQMLSGSATIMYNKPGEFQKFLRLKVGNDTYLEDIKKDVHRQYPPHELFLSKKGQGQEDLFNILKAYSVCRPNVGYCQAQGPIAAVLLTIMPVEQAFWCFVTICDKYMEGYFDPGLETVQIDGLVLFGLAKKVCPVAYKNLKSFKIDPLLYMTEWFMCLFTRTLPWPTLLRVWDMFLCEGIKVIFKVALVLLKNVLGDVEHSKHCITIYDILEKLKRIPSAYTQEEFIIRELSKISITEKDLEKEHEKQMNKWKTIKRQQFRNEHSKRLPKKQVDCPSKITSEVKSPANTNLDVEQVKNKSITSPTEQNPS